MHDREKGLRIRGRIRLLCLCKGKCFLWYGCGRFFRLDGAGWGIYKRFPYLRVDMPEGVVFDIPCVLFIRRGFRQGGLRIEGFFLPFLGLGREKRVPSEQKEGGGMDNQAGKKGNAAPPQTETEKSKHKECCRRKSGKQKLLFLEAIFIHYHHLMIAV